MKERERSSTSPFRGTSTFQMNPQPESLQLLIKSLERENNSLVDEVNTLKIKARRSNQLEQRVDSISRSNNQLLVENEKLAKMINQKKGEVEVWKNKYESLVSNKHASSQHENRRLISELEKLKEDSTELEHYKNLQINQLKNQHHLEIQSIKRGNLGGNEKYELEIRKLKEYCDKKEYEISDFNMKIVRLSKETDFQIGKLREEKQRLRNDLFYEESEHKKELESLKSKFQFNFHSEIQNIKKQHLNQIEALDYENLKLKDVINSKNSEMEQTLSKNLKVKANYEDTIHLLKGQNIDLKDKLDETERVAEMQLQNLRQKLEGIRESELSLLRNNHDNQINILNREIDQLQEIIDNKNQELEIISQEKKQIRQALEHEITKARVELQAQVHSNHQNANKYDANLQEQEYNLSSKVNQFATIEKYLQNQINSLNIQNGKIQELLEKSRMQYEREREEHLIDRRKSEHEQQGLKHQILQLKDELERQINKANSEADDSHKIHQLKIKQLQTKITGLEDDNSQKDGLIEELRSSIALKERQIKLSDQKISHLEYQEKELRREARENLSRWNAKEEQYNSLVQSQIKAMERNRLREISQLNGIHHNKTNTLKHQVAELERHVEDKNRKLNQLKERYQTLVNKFEEIFAQRAAQKNLDVKVPGWLPETIANKSIFDVFLKTKVLQYCS